MVTEEELGVLAGVLMTSYEDILEGFELQYFKNKEELLERVIKDIREEYTRYFKD